MNFAVVQLPIKYKEISVSDGENFLWCRNTLVFVSVMSYESGSYRI